MKKQQVYFYFISFIFFYNYKDVNYLGPIALIKQILPKMQALNKGHIVDISSVVHLLPAVKLADYCGSKAALYNFHSSLRLGIF